MHTTHLVEDGDALVLQPFSRKTIARNFAGISPLPGNRCGNGNSFIEGPLGVVRKLHSGGITSESRFECLNPGIGLSRVDRSVNDDGWYMDPDNITFTIAQKVLLTRLGRVLSLEINMERVMAGFGNFKCTRLDLFDGSRHAQFLHPVKASAADGGDTFGDGIAGVVTGGDGEEGFIIHHRPIVHRELTLDSGQPGTIRQEA